MAVVNSDAQKATKCHGHLDGKKAPKKLNKTLICLKPSVVYYKIMALKTIPHKTT